MKNMTLQNIADACHGVLAGGALRKDNEITSAVLTSGQDTEITSAVLDSRQVTEGALFFATIGERVDGHKFIGVVFEKGACCVVTQKTPQQVEEEFGIPVSCWGAYILVPDTLTALKEIAEFYRSTLNIPIVGITGSVGKTSTKEYIAGVLAQKFHVLKTEGNYNNEIGVPLTLLKIREEHEAAVIEMGISDFGEMHRLSKMVRPNICVITNIGQCHLENLKTRDGILKAKSEIFDFMDPEGEVCLNGEDDKLSTVTNVNGKPVHFFGLGGNPFEEVYADEVVSKGLFGSEAILHLKTDEVLPITVTLPGAHMVINAAAAACVGRILGLTNDQLAEGIRSVEPVNGRSHLIQVPGYTLIDDCYNANPVSMAAAIDLLTMADNRKIAILGDMFELGEDSDKMHEQTGEYAARAGLDIIICIGENSRHMYQGAGERGNSNVKFFATREDFLAAWEEQGEELLPTDSTILVKASHSMGFEKIVDALSSR